MDDLSAAPFTPYAPVPRLRPLSRLGQLWALANNPLEMWTQAHYELPVLAGPAVTGYLVVVNDPTFIRHVLVDNAANYGKDPLQQRVLAAGARDGAGAGLLAAEGDLWKRTRRTLAPLFTPRRVAGFTALMQDRAAARVERWLKRRPGAILDIEHEMAGVTYDILSATLFSDALGSDSANVERELLRLLDNIGRIHPFDIIAAPRWVPRVGRQGATASRRWFEGAIARLMQERAAILATHPDTAPDDLLTSLMRAKDPESGAGLDDAEIAANIFTFIAAGHETTARALAWTLYLLSMHPEWRSRCEAEADAWAGDAAEGVENMPAIRAALEEAMRLFPPVPVMSRSALAPDRLGDTDVPMGAVIIVAPWLLHRHRRLWDDPDAFRPERFMPGARESIDRFAYLPFGAGPRVCIGATFAQQEAIIVLANIVRRVRLSLVGEPPRPVHRITLRPAGRLTMKMLPRA